MQERNRIIDFQDGRHVWYGGHLGFPIEIILAIFDLQVTSMLPTKFQVNWLFGSGGEAKKIFQDGCYGTILTIFDLQVTQMLPTQFQVNWPFGFRKGSEK